MKNQKNEKGFTLAELLIVVAIIGILVAVSIPVFSSQLNKAKIATDKANVRAAKAAAVADYLTSGNSEKATYYYDAVNGTITTSEDTAKTFSGYGKYYKELGTEISTGIPNDGTAHIVSITITSDGIASASWVLGTGTGGGTDAGAAVLTDTAGGSHTFTASTTWEQLLDSHTGGNTVTIQKGLVFSDASGNTYLYYNNDDVTHPTDLSITVAQFMKLYPDHVLQLNGYTGEIYTAADTTKKYSDTVWKSEHAAGTLIYYNGKMYVSASQMNIYEFPPASGNWLEVITK